MARWIWIASALVACRPQTSETTFPRDYAAALCDKADVCQLADLPQDYTECVDVIEQAVIDDTYGCSNFSVVSARKCLSELRKMSCDDASPYQEQGRYPGSCAAVYSCYGTLY